MASPRLPSAFSKSIGLTLCGIVYDPSNHAENILSAARALEQISNQIAQLRNQARNLARLPHSSLAPLQDAIGEDKYPFWLGLGIVYEHFHTAKTIRGATTLKLVPEQYVEVNEEDAKRYRLEDGERVRLVTRRGSYEARISVGTRGWISE